MAKAIVEVVPEYGDQMGKIRHSIAFLLNVIPIILLSSTIGLLTGKFLEMWIALAAFGLLRQTSGGIHLRSSEMCIVFSTVGATIISFSDFNVLVIITMTALSMILVLLFAPSRIEGRTLFPKKNFIYLRVFSVFIVCINFYVQSSVIASAFFIQSLMLITLKRGEDQHD